MAVKSICIGCRYDYTVDKTMDKRCMACCRGDKFETDFRPLYLICRDAIIELANAMNIVADFTEINEGEIDVIFKKLDGLMTRNYQVTIAMSEFHNSRYELSDYIDNLQKHLEKKLSFSYGMNVIYDNSFITNITNSNNYKKIVIERCLKKFADEHGLGFLMRSDDGKWKYTCYFNNHSTFTQRIYTIDLNECDDYMKTISVIENAILHSDLIEKGATMLTHYCYFGVPARGLCRTYGANPVPRIEKVIFNNPATIVMWGDGTKTVVKAQDEAFDEEKGLAMAIAKKALGNEGKYFNEIKKWLPKIEEKNPVERPSKLEILKDFTDHYPSYGEAGTVFNAVKVRGENKVHIEISNLGESFTYDYDAKKIIRDDK